jgi:hypothetical protein
MKMVYCTKSIMLILGLITIAMGAEPQDTALIEIPRIYLTGQEDEVMPGGMRMGQNGMMNSYGSVTINKHFFKIEGIKDPVRVNYLASNLSPHLIPVPEAYRSIQSYQMCRVLTPLLMVVGLVTVIGSISYGINNQTKNELGEYNEMDMTGVFVGIGIAVGSWIPYLASMGGVERAVNKYNRDSRVKE